MCVVKTTDREPPHVPIQEREMKKVEEHEREEMDALRLARMVASATRIQAAWRGYMVRKSAKKGKGKKGGKKGGSKKK